MDLTQKISLKHIYTLTFLSIFSLGIGLFTSMTFLALNHIFIIIPIIYFFNKNNFKSWNLSMWFLLALAVTMILSVISNQDIAVSGFKPLSKIKYYLISLFSILPLSYFFRDLNESVDQDKKIKWLLWAFLGTTTMASLSGMSGVFLGFNFLKLQSGFPARNGGLAGMLMNYAHNLALFQVIVLGMVIYRNKIQKYINLKFLYLAFVINLLGLYTTYTRGAWLAFLVAIPFFILKRFKKLFLCLFIVLALVGFGVFKLAGKSIIRPDSDSERLSQWKAAIAGFKERPILGLGYMNFENLSIPLKKKYNIENPTYGGHAHSNYFELLASTGIIGFLFFILWQASWIVELFKRDDIVANITLPFIIAFIVGGLTQATFILGANLFLIMPVYALSEVNLKKNFTE